LHFGLGSQTATQIRITWPGEPAGEWQDIKADALYLIEKGKAPVETK
jgi:hypothetical protein